MIANAGIAPMAGEDAWQDVIDVNLTGVYHTVDMAIPPMIKLGNGGSIVLTSSVTGLVGVGRRLPVQSAMPLPNTASSGSCGCTRIYCAVQHPSQLRAPGRGGHPDDRQRIHPVLARTVSRRRRRAAPAWATRCRCRCSSPRTSPTRCSIWSSDTGRYVTGVTLPVDAGYVNKR